MAESLRTRMNGVTHQFNRTRVHIGKLPYDTSAEELRRVFRRFGRVTDLYIPTDRNTGRPLGFAFLSFEDPQEAADAIRSMDGQMMCGHCITVSLAHDRKRPSRDEVENSDKRSRHEANDAGLRQHSRPTPAEFDAPGPIWAVVLIRKSEDVKEASILFGADVYPRTLQGCTHIKTANELAVRVGIRVSQTSHKISKSLLVFAEDPRVGGTLDDRNTTPSRALKPVDQIRSVVIPYRTSIPAAYRGEAGRQNPCYVLVTALHRQPSAPAGRLTADDLEFLLGFVPFETHESATEEFSSTQLHLHAGHTAWLTAMAAIEPAVVRSSGDPTLEVLQVDDHIPPELAQRVPFGGQTTRDIIVRPFFGELLELLLRPLDQDLGLYILMGNPGIGKSWFQGYILWALLKAARQPEQNPLFHYKIVLRQVGETQLHMYAIDADQGQLKAWYAHGVTGGEIARLVQAFEYNSSVLYLYDCDESTSILKEYMLHTIATVSPNQRRIKRVLEKGRGVRIFMPTWTEFEILAAGRYIAAKLEGSASPLKQLKLFEDNKILERFQQFGGIPRYVFPVHACKLKEFNMQQSQALSQVPFSALLQAHTDIDTDNAVGYVDPFVLQCHTTDFENFVLRYSSFHAEARIRTRCVQLSFAEAVESLGKVVFSRIPERGGPLLELVTFGMMERKVTNWQVFGVPSEPSLDAHPPPKQVCGRYLTVTELRERAEYHEVIQKAAAEELAAQGVDLSFLYSDVRYVHVNQISAWEHMPQGVLYIPRKGAFQLVEAVARVGDRLYGVHCKPDANLETKFERSTCVALRTNFDLGDNVPIHIWIVTFEHQLEDWLNLLANPWATPKEMQKACLDAQLSATANVSFAAVTHNFEMHNMTSNGVAVDDSGRVIGRTMSSTEIEEVLQR